MRKILAVAIVIATAGCASVKLTDNYDERIYEDSKWQTGLIGAFQDDIVVRHKDGSCVRVTWRKILQLFIPYISTKVYVESPCSR